MKMLETGLAQFQAEYGTYPKSDTVEMGANILYKTLLGDYDENGTPDWAKSNPAPDESVKTFVADLNPGAVDPATGGTRSPFVRKTSANFILVDSWNASLLRIWVPGQTRPEPTISGASATIRIHPIRTDSMWIKNW